MSPRGGDGDIAETVDCVSRLGPVSAVDWTGAIRLVFSVGCGCVAFIERLGNIEEAGETLSIVDTASAVWVEA